MPELLAEMWVQYCRLKGWQAPTSPLAKMVDDATGVWRSRVREFEDFVIGLLRRFGAGEEN